MDLSHKLGLLSLELPDGRRLVRSSDRPRDHLAFLQRALGELREESGRSWSELTRVAVTIGPGSFTGLRVGLATAKGLVFGRETPILPLPSLALPALAGEGPALVCRRAQAGLYWTAYFEDGDPRPQGEAQRSEEDLAAWMKEAAAGTRLVGEALEGDWPLGFDPEPDAAAQLEALARLARAEEGLVAGADRDRLLPRYLAAPTIRMPGKAS